MFVGRPGRDEQKPAFVAIRTLCLLLTYQVVNTQSSCVDATLSFCDVPPRAVLNSSSYSKLLITVLVGPFTFSRIRVTRVVCIRVCKGQDGEARILCSITSYSSPIKALQLRTSLCICGAILLSAIAPPQELQLLLSSSFSVTCLVLPNIQRALGRLDPTVGPKCQRWIQ